MAKSRLFDPSSTKPFALSRSKVELFVDCPRCFYLDRRLGISRPSGFPFNLNSAVDELLKREFDGYREQGVPHPLMTAAGIQAIPFRHPELDLWRSNFKGVRTVHEPSGFELFGAVDDLWIDQATGELIVVDYKSTSKASEVTLDADWQMGYKRQMEFYQWLLRERGFLVSDTGWFVYCNGRRDLERFEARLEFKISLLPYTGNCGWVSETLRLIRSILSAPMPPAAHPDCDYCGYAQRVAHCLDHQSGADDRFFVEQGAPVPDFLKPMLQDGLQPPAPKDPD